MLTDITNSRLAEARMSAQQASQKRLQNRIAVNALRKAKFNKKVKLPIRVHVDLATYYVHTALLQCAKSPTPLFLTLCTHPLHLLLWSQSANRAALLAEVSQQLKEHDRPPELCSLALLLKQSLPDVVAAFESAKLPRSAWLSICRKLIATPVLGHPLVHLQAEQLYNFQVIQQLKRVPNSIWFALNVEQKSDFLEYSSYSILYRWFKYSLHRLKYVLKISTTQK